MKNQSENKVYTLAEVLGKHTIAELKQMTQVLEVKVLSKAKKQEIIDALSAKLLDKELLTAWLLAAGKQEIERIRACNGRRRCYCRGVWPLLLLEKCFQLYL